jgi:hypothetical protein
MDVQSAVHALEMEVDDLGYFLYQLHLSFWIDEFDIRDLTTVGALFDTLTEKMGGFDSPRCLTSFAFYQLRRSLIDVSGLDRESILPTTQLKGFLHPKIRRAWWDVVETRLRLSVPRLRLGRAAVVAHTSVVLLALFAGVVVVTKTVGWEGGVLIEWGIPFLLWFLWKLASRLPRELPAETFGELVRILVRLNQAKLAQEAGGSTKNQAWQAFRELLGSATGRQASSITREMGFPEHLKTEFLIEQ